VAGPLEGIRVLEFTQLIMGPQCCQLLRDLGADVIKIESPSAPDTGRRLPVTHEIIRPPVYYANNRGKRSLAIDFSTVEGHEVVRGLIAEADVLVCTLRPDALDRAGFGYDACRELNPRLVYAVGTTYGPDGPDRERPGNDTMAQAASGMMWNTGTPEAGPQGAGALVADTMGGVTLFGGIVAALYGRERTGEGQRVDGSLLGGQIWAQSSELMAHVLGGHQYERSDRTYPWLSAVTPIGVYATSDGHVALTGPPLAWSEFWRALGRDDLAEDPAQLDGLARFARNDEFVEALRDGIARKTTAEAVALFEQLGAIWAPVRSYDEVIADPQVLASGYLRRIDHPEYGAIVCMGMPLRFSGGVPEPADVAPHLGQDTELVLEEAGHSWDRIAELRELGAI
jgi:crotonobetainyl-CoA:carnitine CoA-transferase CaiB-like acyl-CoA transferase